jgi:hypothetical protein
MFKSIIYALFFFLILYTPLQAKPLTLKVLIDEVRLIRLKKDAAQIIVGNPAIADVTYQSARILVATGKSYGVTNLIVLDAKGEEIFNARLGVNGTHKHIVKVYKGTMQQSLHCAPECQRILTIGDDKSQFEQVADSVTKKFGVVQSAIGR